MDSPATPFHAKSRTIYEGLCNLVDLDPIHEKVSFVGLGKAIFPTPLYPAEAFSALHAAICRVADEIWRLRTKRDLVPITIDTDSATLSPFSTFLVKINGESLMPWSAAQLPLHHVPFASFLTDFWETNDGIIYISQNFKEGLVLKLLGIDMTVEAFRALSREQVQTLIASKTRKWKSHDLEDALAKVGGCAVIPRTFAQFAGTEQGKVLLTLAPVVVEKLNSTASAPKQFCVSPVKHPIVRPLSGIRIVELTKELAGPTVGRILAEFGAEVIRISPIGQTHIPAFLVDLNFGKWTTHINAKDPKDYALLKNLIQGADVFLQGLKWGSTEKLNLGILDILQMVEERSVGIVYVSENCYGQRGPWSDRPGYEQLGQCMSGLVYDQARYYEKGVNGQLEPRFVPLTILDHGTGYLCALGAMTALWKRYERGGSYNVFGSLCQTSIWLRNQGFRPDEETVALFKNFPPLPPRGNIGSPIVMPKVLQMYSAALKRAEEVSEDGPYGKVTYLGGAWSMEGIKLGFDIPTRPLGVDPPYWPSRL
ncbi:hypothetical protein SmJEL517_g01612 [Synchytrium microbalum]|uniref:Uncharacterized protein n=1 Tax=Synchytrium microbalum TaxID=1806994 RepID=A0A507CF48_9FUNG|nr:uncharacterized protein SmJEL517_g01612 [Synchytrium microbalum]TPX36143.1 hypothetical protein SmJEL517_g01612 [Synchytrium microbalum]